MTPAHQQRQHHQQQRPPPSEKPPPNRFLTSTGTVTSSPDGFPCSKSCYGLLITLQTKLSSSDSSSNSTPTNTSSSNSQHVLQLEFVKDQNQPHIHPNSYAPADFTNVRKLGGGGSGVAVFEGSHPLVGGPCVMKHGSDKDLSELFALATIARELSTRGKAFHREAAAHSIQQRIPEFRFLYISPHHLGEKRKALWKRLQQLYQYSNNSWLNPLAEEDEEDLEEEAEGIDSFEEEDTERTGDSEWDDSIRFALDEEQNAAEMSFNILKHNSSAQAFQVLQEQKQLELDQNYASRLHQQHHHHQPHHQPPHHHQHSKSSPSSPIPFGVTISKSGTISGHRDIALVAAPKPPHQRSPTCGVKLVGDSLTIVLPEDQFVRVGAGVDGKGKHNHDTTKDSNGNTNTNNNSHHTTVNPRDVRDSKIQITGMSGYAALKALVDDLIVLMRENKWKFTLGQKKIGGDHPKTGNQWLYAGQLEARLLENLITQKIQLMRDLAALTTPAEQDLQVLDHVQKELTMLEEDEEDDTGGAATVQLSDEADSFVGYAVKKNFMEDSGRFPVLMMLGKRFREHSRRLQEYHQQNLSIGVRRSSLIERRNSNPPLILTPEEEIPAHHLGALTRPGALMEDTFENVPAEPCFLDSMNPFYWRNLLHFAVRQHSLSSSSSSRRHNNNYHPQQQYPQGKQQQQQQQQQQNAGRTSNMAMKRIWTCGFTDAGLHNLFLTEDRLWLFDLGEPQLYSAPGFLTKFLFSFFHTLGMEEVPNDEGVWVNRFVPNMRTGKLRLSEETITLLSKAYDAFEIALDRLVDELFQGDDSLRWLLIQYVTLQLFSDASFCLQKWTIKGGGRTRDSNHQEGIEKWLWRALWDIYVAFDINSRETWSRLKVEHPSNLESMEMSPFIMKKIFHANDNISSNDSDKQAATNMMDQLALSVDSDHAKDNRGFHLDMRKEHHPESIINATG